VSSAPPSFNLVVFGVVMPCGCTRSYQRSWTALYLKTALFWVVTQRVVLISYRRFGTIYLSSVGAIDFPETPVRHHHDFCVITQKSVVLIFAAEAWNRPQTLPQPSDKDDRESAFLCTLSVTNQTKVWTSFNCSSLCRYGFRQRLLT